MAGIILKLVGKRTIEVYGIAYPEYNVVFSGDGTVSLLTATNDLITYPTYYSDYGNGNLPGNPAFTSLDELLLYLKKGAAPDDTVSLSLAALTGLVTSNLSTQHTITAGEAEMGFITDNWIANRKVAALGYNGGYFIRDTYFEQQATGDSYPNTLILNGELFTIAAGQIIQIIL